MYMLSTGWYKIADTSVLSLLKINQFSNILFANCRLGIKSLKKRLLVKTNPLPEQRVTVGLAYVYCAYDLGAIRRREFMRLFTLWRHSRKSFSLGTHTHVAWPRTRQRSSCTGRVSPYHYHYRRYKVKSTLISLFLPKKNR